MSLLMHGIVTAALLGSWSCSGLRDAGVATGTIEIPSEGARLELNHVYAKKVKTDGGVGYVVVVTDQVLSQEQLAAEEEKENAFVGSSINRIHLLVDESGLITYLIVAAHPAPGVSYATSKIYHEGDGRRASIANDHIEGSFKEQGDFGRSKRIEWRCQVKFSIPTSQ